MAFRRACSYQATIKTPVDPSTYSAIAVTFKQGETVVQKTLSDLTLTATSVVVQLTQEETASFTAGKKAYMRRNTTRRGPRSGRSRWKTRWTMRCCHERMPVLPEHVRDDRNVRG